MDRIFWVTCPECGRKFYCDYALRFAGIKLICPFCECEFLPEESPAIDDRA